MGIWDLINSATEAVKQQAPDPTPVVEAYKTSFDYCSAAAGKLDNAVRVNSQRLNNYVSDEETQAQIGLITSRLIQNASQYAREEGYKFVPGGEAFVQIVSGTMRDVELEKQNRKEMEEMKEMFGAGGRKSSGLLEQVETQSRSSGVELGCQKANQSPKEVLNNFMTKEFMGNRFADDLVLPQIKNNVKKN